MDAVISPRKTRSRQRKVIERPSNEIDSEPSTPNTSVKDAEPSVQVLPTTLTRKHTHLNTQTHKILLKKQTWLHTYTISLPYNSISLKPIVDATLVFAQEEAGTAVSLSNKGLLLTCAHCVAESEDNFDEEKHHWLLFASGRVVEAKCIAWDARRDLALLQIIAAQESSNEGFPYIRVISSEPKIKTPLACVGHPGSEDLENSLPGVQTNFDVLHVSTGVFRGYAKGQDLQDNSEIGALKHNCWTYWGHSGAPLVTRDGGELIGLHSSWDDSTGMRRGIPLEAIREFLGEHERFFVDDE